MKKTKKSEKPWEEDDYSFFHRRIVAARATGYQDFTDEQFLTCELLGTYAQRHAIPYRVVQYGIEFRLPHETVFTWWPKRNKCGTNGPNGYVGFDLEENIYVALNQALLKAAYRERMRQKRRSEMGDDRFEKVDLANVTVKRDSGKALLCLIDGDDYWIPKSQIHDDSEVYEMETEGTLIIPRWLAEEKGLV